MPDAVKAGSRRVEYDSGSGSEGSEPDVPVTVPSTLPIGPSPPVPAVVIKVYRLGLEEYTERMEGLPDDHKLKHAKYSKQNARKVRVKARGCV